jgi:urease accessory protein
MQRSHGTGILAVKASAGATRIDRLHQSGNAKIRVPKTYGAALEAVLINTSGGITGGDTLDWTLHAGPGTEAVVTTQACERIYKSTGDAGRQTTTRRSKPARACSGCRRKRSFSRADACAASFRSTSRKTPASSASKASSSAARRWAKPWRSGFFHDRWRIRRDGHLVHADDLRFDLTGPARPKRRRSSVRTASSPPSSRSCRTTPKASTFWSARPDPAAGRAGGASRIGAGPDAKIVIRLAAPSSYVLRRQLLPVIALFLGDRPLPKVWSL